MTHIKQFIEDAIEGGWQTNYWGESITPHSYKFIPKNNIASSYIDLAYTSDDFDDGRYYMLTVSDVLLDPQAWQAVGKTRGWYVNMKCTEPHSKNYAGSCTLLKWHTFIDHLADGHTIEEALAALTN